MGFLVFCLFVLVWFGPHTVHSAWYFVKNLKRVPVEGTKQILFVHLVFSYDSKKELKNN